MRQLLNNFLLKKEKHKTEKEFQRKLCNKKAKSFTSTRITR